MPNDDHKGTASSPEGPRVLRTAGIILIVIIVSGLLFAVLARGDDDGAKEASGGDRPNSPSSFETTTSIDPEEEIISRLKRILATRDVAYRERNLEMLKEIYTVDCPCLKSDSNAIRELLKEDYFWVGGETSIRVRRTERVAATMWIVVADFSSEALSIQSESGRVIRSEPRGTDLFQFVLAKPAGSTQWLLGRASSYEDG